MNHNSRLPVTSFLGGGFAFLPVLALPTCASVLEFHLTEAAPRLLLLLRDDSFARLTADGRLWHQRVVKLGLGDMLEPRGLVLNRS